MIKLYPPIPEGEYNQTSRRIFIKRIDLQISFKGKEKIVRRKTNPNINVTIVIR